jgi:hypothetical protein
MGLKRRFGDVRATSTLPRKPTFIVSGGMSQKGQNRTFVAGFLTSNARHAERSNDRCHVLPHKPGVLARRLPQDRRPSSRGQTWRCGIVG